METRLYRNGEAAQLTPTTAVDIYAWICENSGEATLISHDINGRFAIPVQTSEGTKIARLGDWIVKEDEFYLYSPEAFNRKHQQLVGGLR